MGFSRRDNNQLARRQMHLGFPPHRQIYRAAQDQPQDARRRRRFFRADVVRGTTRRPLERANRAATPSTTPSAATRLSSPSGVSSKGRIAIEASAGGRVTFQ